MHREKLAVRSFFLISIILSGIQGSVAASQGPIAPVCERSAPIRLAISKALGYPCPAGNCPCEKINESGLARITDLSLSGGGLTAIKPGDFSGLTSLQKLDLSNNRLSALPEGIFGDLASILELRVAKNTFTNFPYSQLRKLARLRTLSLDTALLSEMPTDAFDGLAGKPGFRFIVPYHPPACRPYSANNSPNPVLMKSVVTELVNRPAPPFPSMEKYQCIAWKAMKSVVLAAFDLDDSPESPRESRLDIFALRRDDPNRMTLMAASGEPLVSARQSRTYLGFAFDTAPYRLNESERAFGVRRGFEELAYGGATHAWDETTLFRVAGAAITPILSTHTYEYTEAALRAPDGSAYPGHHECKILVVAKSTTLGFFNLIEISNRADSAAVIFRWDGKQYKSGYPPPSGGQGP